MMKTGEAIGVDFSKAQVEVADFKQRLDRHDEDVLPLDTLIGLDHHTTDRRDALAWAASHQSTTPVSDHHMPHPTDEELWGEWAACDDILNNGQP
jgi:hypothetical protein